jgi:flagellar hook-basal body complex protein FliE
MDPLTALRPYAMPGLQPGQELAAGGVRGLSLRELETMPGAAVQEARPTETSFANMLGNLVQDVNAKQVNAGETVRGLLGGENVSLHQAMIAMEEASVSFQLMVEVRNKLLESYQELMRMQV